MEKYIADLVDDHISFENSKSIKIYDSVLKGRTVFERRCSNPTLIGLFIPILFTNE